MLYMQTIKRECYRTTPVYVIISPPPIPARIDSATQFAHELLVDQLGWIQRDAGLG